MGSRVALFYCHKVYASGVTAYTAHLFKALEAAGHHPGIFAPLAPPDIPRGAFRTDQFGEFAKNMCIVQIPVRDALEIASEMPSLIVAPAHPNDLPDVKLMHKLQQKGARVVIHDPTQFKNFAPFSDSGNPPMLVQRPILVREAMKEWYPRGVFIPHPYMRTPLSAQDYHVKSKFAVCTARIATNKRTRMILQANRLLPKRLRVDIKGAGQNRMMTYGLSKTYGDVFKQPKKPLAYPMTFEAPVELCAKYRYHVDFTKFDGDGGGTQYAQLEAIDAGCVPIMHQDWRGTEHMPWMYAVSDVQHLVSFLKTADNAGIRDYLRDTDAVIRAYGQKLLTMHDHRKIGKIYAEELGL